MLGPFRLLFAIVWGNRSTCREMPRRPLSTRWRVCVVSVATILGVSTLPGSALSGCFDYGASPRRISVFDVDMDQRDIAVGGNYTFVADPQNGIRIYDISDGHAPQLVNTWNMVMSPESISVDGSYLYIGGSASDIHIASIADPINPSIVGSMVDPGGGFTVSQGYMFFAQGAGGLLIIDATDPANPKIASRVNLSYGCMGIAADYPYVCVMNGYGYITVIDIHDPYNPVTTSSVDLYQPCLAFDVLGDRLFIVQDGILKRYSISDPYHPSYNGSVELSVRANCVLAYGVDRAIVSYGASFGVSGSIWSINFSNAATFMVDWKIPMAMPALVVQADSSRAVVREYSSHMSTDRWRSQIAIVDIDDGVISPQPATDYTWYTLLADFAVSGSSAFVNLGYGIGLVDVADALAPVYVCSISMPELSALAVDGAVIYAACADNRLYAIDAGSFQEPVVLGSIDLPGMPTGLSAECGAVYVACGGDVTIVDVADPGAMAVTGNVVTPGVATTLVAVGSYAYVADGAAGLQIIDASVPQHPEIIGQVAALGITNDVAVVDARAYVANGRDGLQIIDIADPHDPCQVGVFVECANIADIAVSDEYVYLACGEYGVYVVDVTDPVEPEFKGRAWTHGDAVGIVVANDVVYYVETGGRFNIIPTQCSGSVPVMMAAIMAEEIDGGCGLDDGYAGDAAQTRQIRVTWRFEEPLARNRLRLEAEADDATWSIALGAPSDNRLLCEFFVDDCVPMTMSGRSIVYRLQYFRNAGGWEELGETSVELLDPAMPGARVPALSVCPNPFNPSTQVSYEMARPGTARVTVHALNGALVRVLTDGPQSVGAHFAAWDGRDGRGREMPAGGYVVRIATEAGTGTVKAVLVR